MLNIQNTCSMNLLSNLLADGHARFFAALLLTSAKIAISVSVEPAEMLLMPLMVGLVLVGVGYMLAFLYPVDGVDLAGFFASAAVGATLDASKHVSSGHSDPSDDVLCELHQLCDAELVHDVVHVVELVVGDVAGCCWLSSQFRRPRLML